MKCKIVTGIYNDKPTIFINGRIINGCQHFTLDQLPDVARDYSLSDDDIAAIHNEYYSPQGWLPDINDLVNHDSITVRKAVARYGNDHSRSILLNDRSSVLATIAQFGNDQHRDWLLSNFNDAATFVGQHIYVYVRAMIAKYGNDAHRDILVNDVNYDVLINVVNHGNTRHLHILSTNDNRIIAALASQRLHHLQYTTE